MKVTIVAFQTRAYSQLSFSNAITYQLMRQAINSVTNSVFNSWSYDARSCLVYYPLRSTCTYYHVLFIYRPFVNAKTEKVADHRHKTEVQTREREER